MAHATIDDVRAALVDPDFDMDENLLTNLLDRSETIITKSGYDLDEIEDDVIRLVTSGMVKRLIVNPIGARQSTDVTGPSTHSATFSGTNLGELFLTTEDKRMLSGRVLSQKAYTINPAINMMEGFRQTWGW